MTETTTTASRRTLLAWIGGGTSLAAILAVGTIALWPASATDEARANGEAFGSSVAALQSASTYEEVDAALVDMQDALAESADDMSDEVNDQINDQADALDRAVDGFVGERTADDEFDQELYHSELDAAVDDLTSNADEFRTQGPEVRQAFWDGYDTGLNS